MFLVFGAFIAGMLTVLAPCVLPLLPIIIGGSVTGDTKDKKRPLVIAVSLAISLIVFTLLLKASTLLINVPPKTFTYFSGTIIVLLGLVTLFPSVYAKIIGKLGIEQRATKLLGKGVQNKNSLVGPIITGAALGPVFSSCSPVYAYILATVLPANFAQAMVYMVAYVLGLSLVLLAVGYYGQQLMGRLTKVSDPRGTFQRAIAIIFILVGLLIFTGYDKRLQTWVSQHTPFNFDALSSKLLPSNNRKVDNSRLFNVQPMDAPEFVGLGPWINSKPLTIHELKGKVVLVDFWTYSCINCIRNNPYLERWYNTYKDKGFVVVGVHAPEFAFEKVEANVRKGVQDQHITYPVGMDNDFSTWNAYSNQSWPASYLIDAQGKIRRIHEGEGEYDQEEQAIRALLQENGAKLSGKVDVSKPVNVPVTAMQTPETYLGMRRASNFSGSPALGAAPQSNFTAPASLEKDHWSLSGTWKVDEQTITAVSDSKLQFNVSAKDVYLVAGADMPSSVSITLDGQPLTNGAASDVVNSAVTIGESRLYHLLSFPKLETGHVIELTVPAGVKLNTFTFGS